MKFFNSVKKVFKKEQIVFEQPKQDSKKLIFDLGTIPTILSLFLLFSTVSAGIFLSKKNNSDSFSTKEGADIAGKISISQKLITPETGVVNVGSVVKYKITYSNTGDKDITNIPFTNVFPSANLQLINICGNTQAAAEEPSKDNWLREKQTGKNYGGSADLKIKSKNNDRGHGLMQFDLSSYAGKKVLNAELHTFVETGFGNGNELEVFEVNKFWDEGTFDGMDGASNWTDATSSSSWGNNGGDYNAGMLGSIPTDTKDWHSTSLSNDIVQNWIDNTAQNNGVLLMSSGVSDKEIKLNSREGDPNKRSYLALLLQESIPVDYSNGDTIKINNLGNLAPGETDSIIVSFLATAPCSSCVNEVQIQNALDVDATPSSSVDNLNLSILNDEGQIDIEKTLVSPTDGIADIGEIIKFRVAYSNLGTKDIATIPFTDVFNSASMEFIGVYGEASVVTDQPSKDNWLEEKDDEKNFGVDTELKIRVKTDDNKRGLMHFDLSSYSGYQVTQAELHAYAEAGHGNGNTIDVYEVTKFWDEGTRDDSNDESNWIEATSPVDWDNEGGDYDPTLLGSIPTDTKDWYSTMLPTDVIQNWIDDAGQNFGIILLSSGNTDQEIKLKSNEGDPNKISYLELTLQKNISVDYQNGDTIKINNLGSLSAGATDSIDIYFLAKSECDPCLTSAQAIDAEDVDGALSSNSSNLSFTILPPPGQVTITNTLTDPTSGTATVGDTITFKVAYSNTGTVDLSSVPFANIAPAANMQFLQARRWATVTERPDKDNWLDEDNQGENRGDDNDIRIKDQNGRDRRGLIHFDLSSYTNVTVESAQLYGYIEAGSGNGNTIDVYEVTRFWDEGNEDGDDDESNWIEATQPIDWTNQGGDYNTPKIGTIPTDSKDWYSTSLPTSTVQNWIDNASSNYGMILLSSGNTTNDIRLISREGNASKIPYLEIVLKQELTIDSQNGDTIAWNDLGGMAIGTTDSIEITYLAIDAIDPADVIAEVNGAIDINGINAQITNSTANVTIVYGPEVCNDGLDNDGDSLVDCLDIDDCVPVISSVVTNPSCVGDNDGSITITVSNTSDYSYFWGDISPEGQWTFESTMNDVSGNANHEQVVTGNPAYSNDALEGGRSFEFDGETKIQYSVLTQYMDEDITERTISMWIKPDNLVDNMALYEEGNSNAGIGLRLRNGDVQAIVTENTNDRFPISSPFPNDGNWHHLGLVYDGNNLILYIDGIEVDRAVTGLGTITFDAGNDAYGGIGGNHTWHPFVREDYTGFQIWSIFNSGNVPAIEYYTGLMDNVSNYNVALAPEIMAYLASNSIDRSDLVAGDYTITVVGAGGCSNTSVITLTDPPSIVVDTVIQDQSCSYSSDGKIKAVVSGGTPGYTYLWSTGSTIDSIENLTAGTYTLTVTDAAGCKDTIEAIVGTPLELVLTVDGTSNYNGFEISCNGGNDGGINTTPSGGTSPYTFLWSAGQTTDDISNLSAGTYTITVTDAHGCTATSSTTLTEPTSVGINVADISSDDFGGYGVSCNGASDGEVFVSGFGGFGNYSYIWSNGVTGANGIQNLTPGSYTVTVSDENNCTATATYNLTEPPVLALDTAYWSPETFNGFGVSCHGATDGKIKVSSSGGTGVSTYAWSNGAGNVDSIFNLSPGIYTVTLTDENSCSTSLEFNLTEPNELLVSDNTTNINCFGQTNGSINLSVTGGTNNYTYVWSGGETTQGISGLVAGDYTVTISDENLCQRTETYTIIEPALIAASGTTTDVNCFGGNDGAIAQTVSGGTPPYSFNWSNGETVEDISGLTAGTYTVSITDFYNCPVVIRSYTIAQPEELRLSEVHTDVTCYGGNDGSITTTTTGGTPIYDYLWSNGATTPNLNSIVAGTYTLTVTDGNNCDTSLTVVINESTEIIAVATIDSVLCNGESNGRIALAVSGGNPGYTYSWNNLATTSTINNLSAGTYTVTITDNTSCTITNTYTVFEPVLLNTTISKTNPLCFGETTGTLTANPVGGTLSYSYEWSTGATTATINNLGAGTYTVTVTDKNNCTTTLSDIIATPAELTTTHSIVEPHCNGDSNGSITVTPTGGVSPYTYQWNIAGNSNIIENIPAGNYTVTITDLQNCELIHNITLTEPVGINISSTTTDNLCFGDSIGTIDLTVSGGVPNFVYDWSDMDNEAMWTFEETMDDVSGNNHHPVTFIGNETYSTDAVGGKFSFDFDGSSKIRYSVDGGGFMENAFQYMTISMWVKPDELTEVNTLFERGTSARGIALRMDGSDVQGVVTVGSVPQLTNKVPFPSDGQWHHLALVYNNGELILYLDGAAASTINTSYSTVNASTGNGGIGGSQGSDAFANTQNLYYEGLMDNVFFHNIALTASQVLDLAANNGDRTDLPQGVYNLVITDGNGCVETANITINEPTALVLNTNQTNVSCNGGSDGIATVNPSGGTSPYSYSWGGGNVNNSLTGLSIGDYTVTVTDNNGCTNSTTVSITEPNVLTASATGQDANCNGGSDGLITLSVNGGTPNYSYAWSGGAGVNQNPTGLSAGNYTVTVTDSNGCTTTANATVGEPTPLTTTNDMVDISCNGETDGSITAVPTGGTPNYSYNWSNGATTATISNLSQGTYTVTVTDNNGCTSTSSNVITEPSVIVIGSTITNVSCNGGDDGGVIALNVSGGSPGYTYLWSDMNVEAYYGFEQTMNDETGNNHNPLGGEGIEDYAIDNIERDFAFDFDGSTKIEYEENNTFLNGTISTFSVSMWVKPDNFIGNQVLFEMGGVSDGFGIRLSGNILQVGANESFTLYGLQYPFPNDGGWHHITITFDNGDFTLFFDGVELGTYETGIGSVFISNFQEGGLGGTFGTDAFGGAGDFFYSGLMDGVGYFNNALTAQQVIEVMSNDGVRDLLSADSYTVTVIDAHGCLATETLSITEPPALTISNTKQDIGCNGLTTGEINITVGGGTPNYSYSWSNSSTNEDLTGLSPGDYTVTVTDNNGCTITLTETITEPTSLSLSTQRTVNYSGNDVSCAGNTDGAVEVIVSGGTPNYSYLWSSGQNTQEITGLGEGTYVVTVSDANGCTGTSQITLSAPPSINLTVDRSVDYNNQDISCNGGSDGGLSTTVSGGSGTYTYSWSNGETTSGINNLSAGTYTVTVTDGFGCTVTESRVVSEPNVLDVTISLTGGGVTCPDATDGGISSAVSGGTSGYTYLWNGGQTTSDLTNVGSGEYMVTVTDVNGCTAADTLMLSAPSDLNFTTSFSDLTDCGADDGAIAVSASGGTGDYEYSINGSSWQTDNTFYNLAPGTYNVFVRNSVGTCVKGPKTVVINVPEAPIINNTVLINPTTDVSTDGSIIVNASGNGVQLNYQLEGVTGWQTSSVFANLTEGVYTIKVKYYNQTCETSTTVELVAGGGVVGGAQTTDYCSGDINSGQLVEIYYIPFPEDQVLQSLITFNDGTCGFATVPVDPIESYVSIGVVEEGTIIYYDHWEDGYEPNLGFPIQSTTEIWGDGDITNGTAPGYENNDIFQSSDNIILSETVVTATRQAVVDYDGGDKIASRGNIAMTRLAWATGSETLLAGALEVYPVPFWGTDYEIPVGENYLVNNMFEYTGLVVMASENNTTVNLDLNGDGAVESTITLNQGESFLANGNVNRGGSIQANHPIQVDLVTGDVCAGFESRWFTLKPISQWSNTYYTPVSTVNAAPTAIHIYNGNSSTITIDWETNVGAQTSFTVAPGQTQWVSVPDGSGATFTSRGGENFYAIGTIGSDGGSAFDWGFALIPESQLSPQITLVSLAPGIDPTIPIPTTLREVPKSSWSVHYVDSQQGGYEGTKAFDEDNSTFWHTQWVGGSPTHPHELQIDLGNEHNVAGFRYHPRANCTYATNTYNNGTDVIINNAAVGTYTSDIVVGAAGTVSDLNVDILDIKHTWVGDLEITLTSPSGTVVDLFINECGDDDNILMGLDDEASQSYGCPPTAGGDFMPFGSLSDFDGETVTGTWRLTVVDEFAADGGFIDNWGLEISTQNCVGGVQNGGIADFEFYVSADGVNWGTANATGTFPNSTNVQEIDITDETGRYVRIVANSEINGNPWTTIAELDIIESVQQINAGENYSPVWITAAYPTGSSTVGNINVCVDFNGDGGNYTDANGITYDSLFVMGDLDRVKILDADGDQTGMRIWVCDGSDAILAGAWGQDPSTAPGGSPAIDLGVGLPNGIPFSTSKCVNLSKDYSLDGNFDECDEVIYTIIVENTGVLPLSTGTLKIVDTLPDGLTYIANTTVSRMNGVNNAIPDETASGSIFPLDEAGITYNSIIQPGDSIIIFFQATIDDLTSNGTSITNKAYVNNFQTQFIPEVTFPVDPPEDPLLTGVPPDVTVDCDSIPIAPLLNEPNCTFSNVEYPAAQAVGSTAMDGQALSGDGVTATYTLTDGAITEEFRIVDNLYTRDALQNIPCGASTKAIDFQIAQQQSNDRWGAGGSSTFEINFSQPVENLSFSILDLDEGLFFVDAVEVKIFDGSNTEIDYECGYFSINDNVDWRGGNEFQALDNTDGYAPVAGADDNGDVRFTFYNLLVKRVEIVLKNNWNTSSTSFGTNSATFNDFMAANPGASHGVGIGQMCYCVPGTNEGTIFVANDCAGLVTSTYTEVRTDGSCDSEYTLTRTWTAQDHCNNDTVMTQVISVVDDTPPVFSGIPDDITVTPSTIPTAPTTNCSNGVNLALGKTATQSSTYSPAFPASNMVDGNLNNFAHTQGSSDPQSWWQVDLGTVEEISVVELYNRANCCQSRTSNYYIFVSETPFNSNDIDDLLDDPNVASYYQSTQAAFPTTINIGRVGRYVRVQLTSTTEFLNVAEMMVFGRVDDCISALDGCDSYPTISFTENTVTNLCNYTIERIWIAEDECGNIQRDTQEIFVEALLSATDTVTSDYNGRDISCNGANDGAAHVIPVGGIRPFSYAWSGGVSVDSFATGLSAGTYTVTITDNNGCTTVRDITLNDPPAIDLNAQPTSGDAVYQISCNGASDGTAFALATNGTGVKTYLWSTGATTQAISGLSAGTYTVTATDENSCQTTASVTLNEPAPLLINTSVVDQISCVDGDDGSVLATPAGGATPYSLLWSTNDTDPILSGLDAGTYSITLTDGNGCTVTSSVTLNNPTPISINFNIDNEISCQGGSDGQITASANGGAGGYSYAWSNAASGATISGLSIGKYLVTVTDANSCEQVDSISLTNPNALNAVISVTSDFNGQNISCNGASDGRVKVFGSGGTAPYTYLWNDAGGTTIDSLSGVSAGTYMVTVTDANSCTTTASVDVLEPTSVIADAGSDQNTCANFDVKVGAVGTGGVSNYSYLWSTGETTDSITVNVSVTTSFNVTITDANGCTATDVVQVNIIPCTEICDNGIDDDFDGLIDCDDPDCFSFASASVTSNYNGEDISCDGASDGEARVRPTGGKEPYTYLWSDPLGQTDSIATGLAAGTYTVTVTDDNACTTTAQVTLNDPAELTLTVDDYSGTVSCVGSTDGFIDLSVAGGTTLTGSDYTYAWSTGGYTTQDINPLSSGTYTVTVTDINNCQATVSVTIGEPVQVDAGATIASAYGAGSSEVSCEGGTDGLIVATATGGDGVYEYVWSTGSINDSLINVGAGTYTVTITDGYGCSSTATASITDPPALTLSVSGTAASDCISTDGTITATGSGSTGDLEYSIDNVNWQSSNVFNNLSGGTYSVFVRNTDQTCFAGPEVFVIDEPDAPTITSAVAINPQTAVSADGEILVEAVGLTDPLEYRLVGVTGWQTSSYFQGLNSGTYTIEVRNQGENCPAQRLITLITGGGGFGNSNASYCSDDFSNDQVTEVYYIPIAEDQMLNAAQQLYSSSCGIAQVATDPVRSYVSIGIVERNSIIYFDHWEDDFESDLGNITQATTQVWGDGDLTNGIAPGFPTDIFQAGDIIILDENINSGTRLAVIDFDGGDKIAASGNIAVTRSAWATGSGTALAGTVEVLPTVDWGLDFEIPVGQDADVNEMFEYVGAVIMAKEDNTSVIIDVDPNTAGTSSITLNEGENYLINGGIQAGATIQASAAVQVNMITGDVCADYATRWFTLSARENWSNSYLTPVSTQTDANPNANNNDPTYVHLYNPNNNLIVIKWETESGAQSDINIPANGTTWVEMPDGTGAHFYTNGGEAFYAIATIDSEGKEDVHDWGFAMIPETELTQQISLVPFAPGQDPTYVGAEVSNVAPVWVTGDYPSGSGSSGSFTICIDYNRDGGSLVDVNGVPFDDSLVVNPLSQHKILDPDGNQTGMRIWVCDGSDAIITAAWGQDPSSSDGETAVDEIDAGVSIPNGIPFNTKECVDLSYELNNDGLYDVCEEVTYTVSIQNSGALPYPANTILIIDTLAAELDYVDNSTIYYVNGIPTSWSDDSVPPSNSSFPFDEGGAYYPNVILPGDSIEIIFTASINSRPSGDGIIDNPIIVFDGKKETRTDAGFYVETPVPPALLNIPADMTVSCDDVPNPPALDTANCTITSIPYPAAQPSGTTAMNAQNLTTNGITTTYSVIKGDIVESFNMTDGQYPRSGNQNIPCGASTKAISLTQNQEESNSVYGTGDSTIIRIEFSQEVEDLSFGLLDFDEGIWFLDGATVRVYDATNTEINYDCSQLTVGSNIVMDGSNHFTALDNSDGFMALADTDSVGDVRFNFYDIPVKRVDIVLTNDWNSGSTSSGTSSTSFADYFAANAGVSHGIGISEMCFCVPGTIAEGGTIVPANDCRNEVTIDYAETTTILSCANNYTVTRTWTATDVCGQSTVYTQQITVEDNDAPLISGVPADVTVTPSTIPSLPNVSVDDNCDASPIISYSVDSIPNGCQYIIQRIWEAEDNCSNIVRDTQNITVDVELNATANVTSDYNGQEISCNGASDGVASVVVNGDYYPYIYAWSNTDNDSILNAVTAGTYTVTVTNSIGCTATTSVTINEPSLVQATPKADTSMCAGELFELSVTGSGGAGTYTYSWDNGLGNGQNQMVNPLTTTTYSVTITDINNCSTTEQITVTIVSCPEDCTDGIDNDLDGLTDCDDSDCTPIANNVVLNTCDNSNNAGLGTFILHDANTSVSTESGMMISYHPTLLDAQNSSNILISPFNSGSTTVYARVERVSTGCFTTSEITLNVGAKCAENCNNGIDEDGDGLIDCDDPDCPCCKANAPTLNGLNKKDP